MAAHLESMTVEELTEELTIQQVILDSLEGEQFPGADQERAQARKDIQALKKLLRRRAPRNRGDSDASLPPMGGVPSSVTPSADYDQAFPTVMTTPLRSNGPSRQAEGSLSAPNRKRDFESSNLFAPAGPSKSRRTTPVQSFDPFSSSQPDVDGAEFIDLTGDDDEEISSHYISEQLKAEKLSAQEKADHEFAQILSMSQDSTAPGPSTVSTQPSAYDRLMGRHLSSSNDASPVGDDYDESPYDGSPELLDSDLESGVLQMPGAFPSAAWDSNLRAATGLVNPMANSLTTNHLSNMAVPRPSGRAPAYDLPIHSQGSRMSSIPKPSPSYHNHGFPMGSVVPSHGGYGNTALTNPLAPNFPSAHGAPSSLSGIISRTGTYDYTNGTDGFGNPLPEHLANYLQDAYHDPGMSDKELDDLLQNIRPDMDIPERNRDGTPAGLKRPLYPHQELAIAWMKKMEEGTNKGGILADDMGLGKTISTLALMLARQPTSRTKTNLIVAPVALMRQWKEEIQTKTKLSHRLSVLIHHNKKSSVEELLSYDVVLTTYGTVASELKRLDKYMKDNADRNIDLNNDKHLSKRCPLLHPKKAKFFRVILDEAQCIKNKDTQTAKACAKLKATHRWCLTGTPMMNGVNELYSLLNFLQIKPYCKWEEFRQAFGILFGRNGDPKNIAMNRLRALLKAIMLRRKKNSQLNGKPILKLPEKTEEVVYAELSADERGFYKQLEEKSQVIFSKYLREGSVGKNYSNILVLLLRMRQACCHPHLNLDVDDAATPMTEADMNAAVKALDAAIVERIKAIDDFECPICYDVVPSPTFFVPCGHDSCSECLCRIAENASAVNIQQGSEDNKAKCPVCRGAFDPAKCFSYEAFKKVHMPEKVEATGSDADASDDDDDDASDSEDTLSDSEDVDKRGNLKGFVIADDFESETEEDSKAKAKAVEKPKKKKSKGKGKGKGKKKANDIKPSMLKTLRKEAGKNRVAFDKYMKYLRKTWLPAAKVTECIELLKQISETGEKTIIFSQWTLLLDLLEVAMQREDMTGMERYDGSMSATDRDRASHSFREDKRVKVMLVSLRAGNAGLNLTAASRVIIMDPFWNPYIEMQAVDRAYRIGQQKEVKVYRILTKETVEDRIVELQNRKKDMVEAALDEAEGVKIGRLTTSELKFLFSGRR